MTAPKPPVRRAPTLRSLLFAQFLAVVLAASLVATLFMVTWRLPVARELLQREQTRVAELTLQQIESTLDNTELLMTALAGLVDESMDVHASSRALHPLLGRLTRAGVIFEVLYLVNDDHRVVDIALGAGMTGAEREWVGSDLSGLRIIDQSWAGGGPRWSEQYLSPVQGRPTVAVATPARGGALLAEVGVDRLAQIALKASDVDGLLVVVFDAKGEVVAAPDMQGARQRSNIASLPLVQATLQGQQVFDRFEYGGQAYSGTAVRSPRLAWSVLVAYPAALADASRNAAVLITLSTMLISVAVGLFTLHRLSGNVQRRLAAAVQHAQAVADGHYDAPVEPAGVRELESLNVNLQRMARQIRARENQLRALIDNTPMLAVQVYDRQGRVLEWNPASASIFGWSAEDMVGQTLRGRVYDDAQADAFERLLAQVDLGGRPTPPAQCRGTRRDGTQVQVLSTLYAIPGPQGETRFACMDIDITETSRQQAEIEASRLKFITFFDANPVALAVLRQHGGNFEYLDVNRAWEELVGHPRERVAGRVLGPEQGFTLFADPQERQRFLDLLSHEQGFTAFEFSLRRGDGQLRRVEQQLATVDVAGEALLVYSIQDVTEKRELEARMRELNVELEERIAQRTSSLAQANDELRRTLDELQRAQGRLVQNEKLASLGSLVAGVAHELNTPIGNGLMAVTTLQTHLAALRGQVERGLTRSAFNAFVEQVAEGSDIAVRNLARASALLRSFKRVSADQTSEQRRVFDLQTLVDEMLLTLQPTLRSPAVALTSEVEPGLALDSYPGALGQVLTNLVQNAAVHAFEGHAQPQLTVRGWRGPNDTACLEVADNGSGIAPENLRRVFDPFFTTRLGQGGSGLGLSIVRSIVTGRLGGRIGVRSQLGQGTRFQLELPCRAPEATSPGALDTSAGALGGR